MNNIYSWIKLDYDVYHISKLNIYEFPNSIHERKPRSIHEWPHHKRHKLKNYDKHSIVEIETCIKQEETRTISSKPRYIMSLNRDFSYT